MALDTLKASRELQAAGFAEAQADAIIAIVAGGEPLTRIDLERVDENLRAEMRLLRSELRGEMRDAGAADAGRGGDRHGDGPHHRLGRPDQRPRLTPPSPVPAPRPGWRIRR